MVRCFSQVQAAQGTSVVEPKAGSDVPVYLKPYDKTRYEVPMEKIKLNSGTCPLTQATPSWKSSRSPAPKS
jgi:hypothetical protein